MTNPLNTPKRGKASKLAGPGGRVSVFVDGKSVSAIAPVGIASTEVIVFRDDQGQYYVYGSTTAADQTTKTEYYKRRQDRKEEKKTVRVAVTYSLNSSGVNGGRASFACYSPRTPPPPGTTPYPVGRPGDVWAFCLYASVGSFWPGTRYHSGQWVYPLFGDGSEPLSAGCVAGRYLTGVSNTGYTCIYSPYASIDGPAPRLLPAPVTPDFVVVPEFRGSNHFAPTTGISPGPGVAAELGLGASELPQKLFEFYGISPNRIVTDFSAPPQPTIESSFGGFGTEIDIPHEFPTALVEYPSGNPILRSSPSGFVSSVFRWYGVPVWHWRITAPRVIVQGFQIYADGGIRDEENLKRVVAQTRERRGGARTSLSDYSITWIGMFPAIACRAYNLTLLGGPPPPPNAGRSDWALMADPSRTACRGVEIGGAWRPPPPASPRSYQGELKVRGDNQQPPVSVYSYRVDELGGDPFEIAISAQEQGATGFVKYGIVDPLRNDVCKFKSYPELVIYSNPELLPTPAISSWLDFRAVSYLRTTIDDPPLPANACFRPFFQYDETDPSKVVPWAFVNFVNNEKTIAIVVDPFQTVSTPEGEFRLLLALAKYSVKIKAYAVRARPNPSGTACELVGSPKEFDIEIDSLASELTPPNLTLASINLLLSDPLSFSSLPATYAKIIGISVWADPDLLGV